MRVKISIILLITLISVFFTQSYAEEQQLHVYHKYSVKTWWDKSDVKGEYESIPIYSNQLEMQSFSDLGGTNSMPNPYTYKYTSYDIVPVKVMGQTSYKIEGKNRSSINSVGQSYLDVSGEYYKVRSVISIKEETGWYHPWVLRYITVAKYGLKINYYYNEYKDKDTFISEVIAPNGTYPSNGLHTDGYWYVDMGVLNNIPSIDLLQPITNERIGNQDNLIINGTVKDKDVGDKLIVKYSINDLEKRNITLTQPTSLITNGQTQSFQGYIKLSGLDSGKSILQVWVEDDKGGKSNVIKLPIIIYNTLENILESIKSYIYEAEDLQILVVNSNSIITQNPSNDILIEQIKQELEIKKIKLFFIGKDGETEDYIKSKLLQ